MKKIMKKVSIMSIALIVTVIVASCGSKDDVYKVAMEPTFPPFDTTDENGALAGFDVDLMEAIAEDQKFEIEWTNMGFDGLIPALQSGSVDIIASGMWASDERKEQVDFSETYYDSGLVIAVKSDDVNINSEADLTKDMIVAAQIGTSSADLVKKWEEEGKIKQGKIYDKVNDAVMDMLNGTVIALVNDKPVTLEYMSKQKGKIKIVGDTLNEESYGIAVKKGNEELLSKINKGLENLSKNGELDKLLKKWNLK